MNFDFSKKWDNRKKSPFFDPKGDKDVSLLFTKCGRCFDLRYNDPQITDGFVCGFDWSFLPKEAPIYFAEKCRVFTPLTLYCTKPLNERALKWMERMNPEARYEDYIPIELNEASSNWKKRSMRNA